MKIILDTDMGGGSCRDVDDVGTLCMLNALVDNGEAELLAVMVNTMPSACTAAVSVLQRYYGRDEVPIGAYKGGWKGETAHSYVHLLRDRWPSRYRSSSEVPDATVLYRCVLAAQPDTSVVIASVGMMSNLASLLRSGPDEHSPLTGPDLVARKVRQLGFMAGNYPGGSECNMRGDLAASAFVSSHLPPGVPAFYLGYSVGDRVLSGAALTDCAPPTNPCRQAYIDYLGGPHRDRPSWDPLTALVGVRNASAARLAYCTDCDGRNHVDAQSGANSWKYGNRTNQTFLTIRDQDTWAAAHEIDKLLCQTPKALLMPPASPQPPAPPPAMPKPPSPPAVWVAHPSANCWGGMGAVDLEARAGVAYAAVASVEECKEACNQQHGCTAITISHEPPLWCFRRAEVDIDACLHKWGFDTYERVLPVPLPPSSPPPPLPAPLPPPPPPPPRPSSQSARARAPSPHSSPASSSSTLPSFAPSAQSQGQGASIEHHLGRHVEPVDLRMLTVAVMFAILGMALFRDLLARCLCCRRGARAERITGSEVELKRASRPFKYKRASTRTLSSPQILRKSGKSPRAPKVNEVEDGPALELADKPGCSSDTDSE